MFFIIWDRQGSTCDSKDQYIQLQGLQRAFVMSCLFNNLSQLNVTEVINKLSLYV